MSVAVKIFNGMHATDASAPDEFMFDGDKGIIRPDDGFVISRTEGGMPLSLFGDGMWDLSPYALSSSSGKGRMYFSDNIKKKDLIIEVKRIMFLLMLFGKGRNGTLMSPGTLYSYYRYLLVPMTDFAIKKNTTITKVFEDHRLLEAFFRLEIVNKNRISTIRNLLSLMQFFANIDNRVSGIRFKQNDKLTKAFTKFFYKHNKIKQTPLIPPDVYAVATRQRWDYFYEALSDKKGIEAFLINCMTNHFYARNRKGRVTIGGEPFYYYPSTEGYVSWETVAKDLDLGQLFERHNIFSRKTFSDYLNKLMATCRHLLISYTGMRAEESLLLEADCVSTNKDGKTSCVVGVTKKVSGAPMDINWVTIPEIVRVVEFVSDISGLVLTHRYPNVKSRPLFVRTRKFLKDCPLDTTERRDATLAHTRVELDIKKEDILITEEHIEMLEEVDPLRDWREDSDYKVGKAWNFNFHQYRRSLAVYALNSGYVSITALKKQFGHLFREMTAYYGNGAGGAKSLVGTDAKEHVMNEMQKVRPLFDMLSYAKNVLFSDEPLYGAHGAYVERHEKDIKDYMLKDRAETLRKYEKGLLKHKETAIGSCTSLHACDSHLMGSFVACFGCGDGEIKKSKVENTIRAQRRLVDRLDKESVEYRSEARDLDLLEKNLAIMERKDKNEQ